MYKHGVSVEISATEGVSAPQQSMAGLQVVVGCAPVHLLKDPMAAVNTPILANTFAEAAQKVGYMEDMRYTICQAVAASFKEKAVAPMVIINVLDPTRHTKAMEEVQIQLNEGGAVLEKADVLLDQLVVKQGSNDGALTAGVDYLASYNAEGFVQLAVTSSGKAKNETSLKVSGKQLDLDAVTDADVAGSVDMESGKETGLELVDKVYPMLGVVPGILLAPMHSKSAVVSAALQAKAEKLAGFKACMAVIDLDTATAKKYDQAETAKKAQGVSSKNAVAVWPCVKTGRGVVAGSVKVAAAMAATDAENGDVPFVSPSNQDAGCSVACLADGTTVNLTEDQAATVNGAGIVTFLYSEGMKVWGNNTAAYPGTTDPAMRWISVVRFMLWAANNFIKSYRSKLSRPMNKVLIENILDSENAKGSAYVNMGACARYEVQYLDEDNTTADKLDGKLHFRMYVTPYPPAENIIATMQFDVNALSS